MGLKTMEEFNCDFCYSTLGFLDTFLARLQILFKLTSQLQPRIKQQKDLSKQSKKRKKILCQATAEFF